MGIYLYQSDFKKSDLGFHAVRALEHAELIDEAAFNFLRNNTSCSFHLLKKMDEVTDTGHKYRKYRTQQEPEFFYKGEGYYIARNRGINNTLGFIQEIEHRFSEIKITVGVSKA